MQGGARNRKEWLFSRVLRVATYSNAPNPTSADAAPSSAPVFDQESYEWAALPAPLHGYQASHFKLAQCPSLGVCLHAPFLKQACARRLRCL